MTKEEIAGVLEQIATLLELKGENPFKVRAYANAARAIKTFGGNISNLRDEEALAKIPGVEAQFLAMKLQIGYLPSHRGERSRPRVLRELFNLSNDGQRLSKRRSNRPRR